MNDIKAMIKRHCAEYNRIVNVLLDCEKCNYFGGEDILFTRYSCLHPETQKIINEAIKEAKKADLELGICPICNKNEISKNSTMKLKNGKVVKCCFDCIYDNYKKELIRDGMGDLLK